MIFRSSLAPKGRAKLRLGVETRVEVLCIFMEEVEAPEEGDFGTVHWGTRTFPFLL